MATTHASAPTGGASYEPSSALASTVRFAQEIIPPPDEIPGEMLVDSLYTNTEIVCRWIDDPGVAMLAPTDADARPVFVALAAPTLQLVVEYKCERVGAIPAVPSRDLGPNYQPLGGEHQPAEPIMDASGNLIYRAAGWMRFGIRDASKVRRGSPVPPWLIDQIRQLKQNGSHLASEVRQAASSAPLEDDDILPWAN